MNVQLGTTAEQKDHNSQQLPHIAIVMVTRNRIRLLLNVLSQVRELDYPKELLEIYLLDGASTDGTVEKVKEQFPSVHIMKNRKNIGIAAAENIVIKEVLKDPRGYKYIWLLDDDAEIESQTLIPLVEEAEKDSRIAVIGSVEYDPHRRDQLITAGLRILWEKVTLSVHIPEPEDVENLFDMELVPACSSLTRADVYRKIGLWDERFSVYWPDNDWCMRALRSGYRVCCIGKSKIWHREWAKVKRTFHTPIVLYGTIQGTLLFFFRYSPLRSISNIKRFIFKCYLKAAFEQFTMRPHFSRSYDESVQDILRGDFTRKDFSSWFKNPELLGIEDACQLISKNISGNSPSIILCQINDEIQKTEIRRFFSEYFDQIKWEEIPITDRAIKLDPSDLVHDYLFYHFPRMILRFVMFYKRRDVVISPIDIPNLNTVSSAKYTMFIDESMNCCIVKNSTFKSWFHFFYTIGKGLLTVTILLPRSLRDCQPLKEAITDHAEESRYSIPVDGLE